jgi:hypothetical protein
MLVNPDHTAFEDAVIALNSVCIDLFAAFSVAIAILAARMLNSTVLGKVIAKFGIDGSFVGHDVAFSVDVLTNDRDNHVPRSFLDVERTSLPTALHKGENRILVARAALNLKSVFAANVGFVDLHNAASSAHWRESSVAHCLTDAVGKKPSGFHAARKHPLDLIGGDTFLAGAHQVDNLEPQMQRKVGTLKDGPLSDGELPLALVALVKAKASSLAFHLASALSVGIAAMRANWTIWPKPTLDIRESSFLVEELGAFRTEMAMKEYSNLDVYPTDDQVARMRPIAQAWFDGLNAGMQLQLDILQPDLCRSEPRASHQRRFFGRLLQTLGIGSFRPWRSSHGPNPTS